MNRSFASYYFDAFLRPRETFAALLADERRLRFGFYAVLIQAVVYTLVYVFLILGGGRPFKPWLAIPEEQYYRYNVWFLAPSMVLGWILAAGVAQLLSRAFHGRGRFEDTLSLMGFGLGVASWATGLHDLLSSFLGAIHVIDQRAFEAALNAPTVWRALLWVLMIAYLIWFVVLFARSAETAHGIKGGRALVIGLLGFVVYQGFFLIFNR